MHDVELHVDGEVLSLINSCLTVHFRNSLEVDLATVQCGWLVGPKSTLVYFDEMLRRPTPMVYITLWFTSQKIRWLLNSPRLRRLAPSVICAYNGSRHTSCLPGYRFTAASAWRFPC